MRVLAVIESGLGSQVMGHARFATLLEAGLAQRDGVDLRVVGLPPLAGWSSRLTADVRVLRRFDLDAKALRWHAVQSLRVRRIVQVELARHPADVVIVLSHAVGLALDRLPTRPAVVLVADTAIWEWRAMALWRPLKRGSRASIAGSLALERHALDSADSVIAWSDWTRATLARAAPGASLVTLHPGLDLARYHPAAKTPRKCPRALFVGGRFGLKGGWDLLEAVRPMLDRGIELDLVTPETLPPEPGVRHHRLGADDPELVSLYQQADVLCLPSRGEAVPWVVLEAMACATPVVATGVGAIPEMLAGDHGPAGTLVPIGDVGALRRAINELAADPALRATMGANGRAACERSYDARVQTDLLVERLADLAAKAAERRR